MSKLKRHTFSLQKIKIQATFNLNSFSLGFEVLKMIAYYRMDVMCNELIVLSLSLFVFLSVFLSFCVSLSLGPSLCLSVVSRTSPSCLM